ncbi:MAG: DMT family transporter [Clostridia bacterium]
MDNKLKGIVFMCCSALAFASMQALVALTADTVPLFEQLFFRNLIATLVAFISVYKNKLPLLGTKGNRKVLILRSLNGYLGMITLFYASANANQGDVAIINKMSPFIVTILAFLFLKEKITKYQVIGLLVAFGGAFFVANPQFNSNLFPIFVAILSAFFSGFAYTFLGLLKGREHPAVIIFFFSAFSTIFTAPVMMLDFVLVPPKTFLLLLCIGLSAALGQICLTYAYSCSKASEVSIYNYSGIIFSMILGYIFLEQAVPSTSSIGAILVIISALIVYFGNRYDEKLSK